MTIALSKLNFRDLGGLPTQDARRVRHGLLFRSEGPASFFDDHRAELGALGIRSVCDLRSAGERDTAPNDWCGPECRILNLDMNTDLRAQGEDIWESLRRDPSAENARRVMTENYRMMPQALEAHMLPLVDALLNGKGGVVGNNRERGSCGDWQGNERDYQQAGFQVSSQFSERHPSREGDHPDTESQSGVPASSLPSNRFTARSQDAATWGSWVTITAAAPALTRSRRMPIISRRTWWPI